MYQTFIWAVDSSNEKNIAQVKRLEIPAKMQSFIWKLRKWIDKICIRVSVVEYFGWNQINNPFSKKSKVDSEFFVRVSLSNKRSNLGKALILKLNKDQI